MTLEVLGYKSQWMLHRINSYSTENLSFHIVEIFYDTGGQGYKSQWIHHRINSYNTETLMKLIISYSGDFL